MVDRLAEFYHSPLFEHIQKYLLNCSCGETVFLFVPYIKTKVLKDLVTGMQSRIVIVTTWEPKDIQFGSSDLDLYPFCKKHGITMYVNSKIHLKVYSIGLTSAILATGNISSKGLLPAGNYEAGTILEHMTNEDRLFFENMRRDAKLMDDVAYYKIKKWVDENQIDISDRVTFDDITYTPKKEDFSTSALPMTRSIDELVLGYTRIIAGKEPSDDPEISACVFHDLVNYQITLGFSEDVFLRMLSAKFFAHPFIQKIDRFIAPEAYFGRIKEWIQNNCTDVPVPSRREITENVQVLLEWFEVLGNGKYAIDVPGRHSQRIKKT